MIASETVLFLDAARWQALRFHRPSPTLETKLSKDGQDGDGSCSSNSNDSDSSSSSGDGDDYDDGDES